MGMPGYTAATVTMYRAADGSLIVLENPFLASVDGEVNFQKWWRWKVRAEPARPEGAARTPNP